jgi:1,4-alpha-glucan branching enzyme
MFMGTELAPWQEWNDAGELPWHLLDHAPHRGVHDVVRELNRVAGEHAAMWARDDDPDGFRWLDADDATHSLYAFVRFGPYGSGAVACVANFTPVPRSGYRVGLPWAGPWPVALDTDAAAWWGSGVRDGAVPEASGAPWQSMPCSAIVDVGPMSVLWLTSDGPPD